MTNISPWHPIDRFLACILMSMELVRILVMRAYTRPLIYILYLTCCGVAIFCFFKSQEAQKSLNADGFVFWHNGWHCYPITVSIVHLLDCYLNRRWAEYCYFDCDVDDERADSSGCEQEGILVTQFNNPKDDLKNISRPWEVCIKMEDTHHLIPMLMVWCRLSYDDRDG